MAAPHKVAQHHAGLLLVAVVAVGVWLYLRHHATRAAAAAGTVDTAGLYAPVATAPMSNSAFWQALSQPQAFLQPVSATPTPSTPTSSSGSTGGSAPPPAPAGVTAPASPGYWGPSNPYYGNFRH